MDITLGGQVNTWKLDLNPSNGKCLAYNLHNLPPMHLTIHTGKLYVTEGVKSVVKALTMYFGPLKNVIYQTYVFRQAIQGKEWGIDEFHTHLRCLEKHCKFADADFEIKMQIVTNGTSSRLSKKALQDP